MPLIIQTFEDVTSEVKRLWDQLDLFRTKNIDLSRRRVINASRAIDLHDYIIKEELNEVISSIPLSSIIREVVIDSPIEEISTFKRVYTKVILIGNFSVTLPTAISKGDSHVYNIQQNDPGGHLLTWSVGFEAANLWPISSAKNTYNIFEFIADEEDQKLYLNGFPTIGQPIS